MIVWRTLVSSLSRLPCFPRTGAASAGLLLLLPLLGAAGAGTPAQAQNDGSTYPINTDTSVGFGIPAHNLDIGEGNVSPFTVFLVPGFSVAYDTYVANQATVYLTGGTIGDSLYTSRDTFWNPTIYMSGGTITNSVNLDSYWYNSDYASKPQASRFFMSGGTVGSIFTSGTRSSVNLSGGSVLGPVVAFGINAVTKISGGMVGELVQISGGTADITGGIFGMFLHANKNAQVNWKGGLFAWDLVWVEDNATVNVYGSNLSLVETGRGTTTNNDGEVVPYIDSRLSGTLADGTVLVDRFVNQQGNGKINLIGSLAGLANLRLSAGAASIQGHNTLTPQTTGFFTLANGGTGVARNIVIETITVGTQTATGLNISLPDIASGASTNISRTFEADYAGSLPGTTTIRIQGRFGGGTFNISRRVTVSE